MVKKLIVRISEGLGNQLFMYANAYSLSKSLKYKLYIDNVSAYKKLKIRNYLLDKFNISSEIAEKNDLRDTFTKYLLYKFKKKADFLKKRKSFLIEHKNSSKETHFKDLRKKNYSEKLFIEGYFQSEKYFQKHKNEIKKEFQIKDINYRNLFFDPNKIKDSQSVSISIRQHRFDEKKKNIANKEKSSNFTKETVEYVNKSIFYFREKLSNPKFYIFSNDLTDLDKFFTDKDMFLVKHTKDKIINDFYLSSKCRHFIVGPTTFHWWTAYLSEYSEKMCIRPPDHLNFSSNKDIFPDSWVNVF